MPCFVRFAAQPLTKPGMQELFACGTSKSRVWRCTSKSAGSHRQAHVLDHLAVLRFIHEALQRGKAPTSTHMVSAVSKQMYARETRSKRQVCRKGA